MTPRGASAADAKTAGGRPSALGQAGRGQLPDEATPETSATVAPAGEDSIVALRRNPKNRADRAQGASVYEVVAGSRESLHAQFAHLAAVTSGWPDADSEEEFAARLPAIAASHIDAIVELCAPFDAFDLLELQREFEFPMRMADFHESTTDQSIAVVDLLAVILIARGSNYTALRATTEAPASVTEAIHAHARALLAIGGVQLRIGTDTPDAPPLTNIAAQSTSHALTVRNWGYLHVQDEINTALLGGGRVTPILDTSLGLVYDDYQAVRYAVAAHWQYQMLAAAQTVAGFGRRNLAEEPLTEDEVAAARLAGDELFGHPGRRASFTEHDLESDAAIPIDRIRAVLETFTVPFADEPTDIHEAGRFFMKLRHDVFGRQVVRLHDRHLALGTPIGTDSVRQAVECRLKGTKAWDRYQKARGAAAEAVAIARLTQLLDTPPHYENLKYLVPADDETLDIVGRSTPIDQPLLVKETESDALFVIDDVAICLEVKSGMISAAARRGDVRRLANDLRRTVADAVSQAERLRRLILTNGGLRAADRTWIDLPLVREVHSVVVSLDDLGVLGIAVDELARAGLLAQPELAWITSLHDLTVVAEVIEEPAEFLLYLRRRTDHELVTRYEAVDELDLLMLFLDGDLYVEADPDEIARRYPEFGPASAEARARYRKQPARRRIGTLTDPLDAWVYRQEGSGDPDAPKPTFDAIDDVRSFVAWLHQARRPGWLRTGADLFALAHEPQTHFAQLIDQVRTRAQRDGKSHHAIHTYPGNHGYPGVLIGVAALHETTAAAFARLKAYGAMKKHQLRLDRLTIVLLDRNATPIAGSYDIEPWRDDAELDALIEQAGLRLQPPNVDRKPPSARRSSRRLN